MAACADKVGSLGDDLLIGKEVGEGLVAHPVEARAHIVGGTVGREDRHALQSSLAVETVYVLQAHVVVELALLRLDMEVVVHDAARQEVADTFLVEAVGENAILVHQVGHED